MSGITKYAMRPLLKNYPNPTLHDDEGYDAPCPRCATPCVVRPHLEAQAKLIDPHTIFYCTKCVLLIATKKSL